MTFVIARRACVVAALSLVSAGLLAGRALRMARRARKVVEKIEIDAPAAKVWEIVGNFQDLNWHPGRRQDGRDGRQRRRRQAHADPQGRRHNRGDADEI